jgi:hypothetical protein
MARRLQGARRPGHGAKRPEYDCGVISVHTDSRVDDYIGQLPDWQQAICQQVRELVHAADPEVEETIKRSVRPYFVLQGNICALLAARDHVNVFIYDPAVGDPHGIINQGHGNATAQARPGLPRRGDQRPCPAGNVPGRHREQPRRRLAAHHGITPSAPAGSRADARTTRYARRLTHCQHAFLASRRIPRAASWPLRY